MLRILAVLAVIAGLLLLVAVQIEESETPLFREVGVLEVEGNAEIVQASPDGMLLAHTNSKRESLDLVDITDPANPVALSSVELPGEPTSVALSPDGDWALVAVSLHKPKPGKKPYDPLLPGVLALIDISNPAEAHVVSMPGIGHQPDSIAVSSVGYELLAILAIENEPISVTDGLMTDDESPGNLDDISQPGYIQVVAINPAKPRNWRVATIPLKAELLSNALMLYPEDPQPEYVALSPGKHLAAVSLQENNGIVVIDPVSLEIVGAFNLGTVTDRPADLRNDEQIVFDAQYPSDVNDQPLAGTRFPDAIAFTPDGQYLLSADEGELAMSGGRGFSIWSLDGNYIWDDGGEIERRAAEQGLYPDSRSAMRGIELEGITAARFNMRDYAFAVAERGSFMAIYDITNPLAPEFVQIIATGEGPEGVIAIPDRGLIAVAAEESGTLHIYTLEPLTP